MATTITKEQLLNAVKPKSKKIVVDGLGELLVRSTGEVQRSRRTARLYDENGKLNEETFALRRIHAIVDQVMADENTPMFTEQEAKDLFESDSHMLDKIYAAIVEFNGEEVGKKDE